MKLLITGANGFLGRHVVTEAVRRGHWVRAVVRPRTDVTKLDWYARDGVEVARADLRSRRGLVDVVSGVDCVLHLAAAKSGDLYAQYAGTVVATENLLAAMTEAGVRRIVLVSSFAVYDYLKLHDFSLLDENSPLETDAFDRDEYGHTKLVQEQIVREHAKANGWGLVVLRPGVIWGRDNLFTARLGMQAGRIWVRTGGFARLPLTYVENCAEAIVLAAESKSAQGKTFNVIDDEHPTQRRFARLLQRRTSPRPVIVPVPLWVMRVISGVAWQANQRVFGGRMKIPGLFVPARLAARCRPLRFTNQAIKTQLGWKPRYSLAEALDRGAATAEKSPTKVVSRSAPARAEVPA